MKTKLFSALILIAGLSGNHLFAQNDSTAKDANKMSTDNQNQMSPANQNQMSSANQMQMPPHSQMAMPDLKSWPKASQMAAEEMMQKYGNPDVMGNDVLVWINKGMWKRIVVNKQETPHNFPVQHTDMLMQSISHKVPLDKYDELAKFDGSVIVNRTQGFLSARCDKEANNILALNLAHDIITGKKSVEQARSDYGKIVMEKMKGGNPEYMQKLLFSPDSNAADADINTTGLDKDGNKVGSNGSKEIKEQPQQ